MKPSELLRAGRGDQLGQHPRARRRLGYGLVIGVGAVGGGRYLATVHAPRLDLPHDVVLPLIITAGIVAIVLGWRLILFLERRDQRRQQMVAGLQGQKGEYRQLKHDGFEYTAWPTAPEASSPSLRLVDNSKTAKAGGAQDSD
jgi:hypothetical protein